MNNTVSINIYILHFDLQLSNVVMVMSIYLVVFEFVEVVEELDEIIKLENSK